MNRFEVLNKITESGVVAIMRSPGGDVVEIADALCEAGVRALEITTDTPGVLGLIERLRNTFDDVAVGAGTVLDPETAKSVIAAGAQFIVCPTLNTNTIEIANRYDKLILPGVYTPTEILTAFQAGAPAVKVFPAVSLGPEYIRQVRAPLAQVPLIPTGGVDLGNAAAFIKAGAAAVGIGGSLIGKGANARADILDGAQKLVKTIAEARRG